MRRDDSDSEAGFSTMLEGEAEQPPAPRPAAGRRYRLDGILGRGGMGEVLVAFDRQLQREVALKRISFDGRSDTARARLRHEAAITAKLEHPGIVPVYDAGTGDEGDFYTMRLIRGRPLSDKLRGAATLEARLALLRPFLAVCEAVAYAHSRGVVHRDLKPSNVMVGEFGQTLVVDWGIAAEVGHEGPTVPVGTPAYVSPGQARAEAPDPRHDVFSLGCILHEIIVGEPVRDGGKATMVAAARAGDEHRERMGACDAPPELLAICEAALGPADERYADGEALARDVERFLDGRRVLAYSYSRPELVGRFVREFRRPLAIAGLAAIVLGVGAAISWARLSAAERRASEALAETDETLGWALEAQALSAFAEDALPEAELLAAHALGREESAAARGVLGASRALRAEAFRQRVVDAPAEGRWLDWTETHTLAARPRDALLDGSIVLPGEVVQGRLLERGCVTFSADRAIRIHSETGELVAERLHASRRLGLVVSPSGRRVLFSGGHGVAILDAADGRVLEHREPPCEPGGIEAATLGSRRAVIACEGALYHWDLAIDAPLESRPLPWPVNGVSALALDETEQRVALGTDAGWAAELSLANDEAGRRWHVYDGAITGVAFVGPWVAVAPDRRSPGLWDLHAGTELLRFPGGVAFALIGRGGALSIVGRHMRVVRLDEAPAPFRFRAPEGLAHAAPSPDGIRLAAARGDGELDIWDGRSGQRLLTAELSEGVVKGVSWTADGRYLAAALADERGAALIDAISGEEMALPLPGRPIRRVVALSDGSILAVPYRPGIFRLRPGEPTPGWIETPRIVDLDETPDHRGAVLLSEDGEVLWIDGSGELEERLRDPNGIAVGATDGAAVVVVAHSGAVAIHRRGEGTAGPFETQSRELMDVAITPDGALVATASRFGDVEVLDAHTGRTRMILRAHAERIASVAWGPDEALYSASWDGTVRRWAVGVALAPAGELRAAAEARWGLALEDALHR